MASGRVRMGCRWRKTLFMIASERPRTDVGQPLRTMEPLTSSQVRLPSAAAVPTPARVRGEEHAVQDRQRAAAHRRGPAVADDGAANVFPGALAERGRLVHPGADGAWQLVQYIPWLG